jgi:CheY-like chemotaxis protein
MAKILVAEDEPLVRMLIVEALGDEGHMVLEAEDGEAALALFEDNRDIALLLTDVRMPRMTGYELAAAARHLRPALHILFLTGYAKEQIPAALAEVATIQKPFDVQALQDVVSRLLTQPAG